MELRIAFWALGANQKTPLLRVGFQRTAEWRQISRIEHRQQKRLLVPASSFHTAPGGATLLLTSLLPINPQHAASLTLRALSVAQIDRCNVFRSLLLSSSTISFGG